MGGPTDIAQSGCSRSFMTMIATGVTSVVGVPSTHLVQNGKKIMSQLADTNISLYLC